eukprot:403354778
MHQITGNGIQNSQSQLNGFVPASLAQIQSGLFGNLLGAQPNSMLQPLLQNQIAQQFGGLGVLQGLQNQSLMNSATSNSLACNLLSNQCLNLMCGGVRNDPIQQCSNLGTICTQQVCQESDTISCAQIQCPNQCEGIMDAQTLMTLRRIGRDSFIILGPRKASVCVQDLNAQVCGGQLVNTCPLTQICPIQTICPGVTSPILDRCGTPMACEVAAQITHQMAHSVNHQHNHNHHQKESLHEHIHNGHQHGCHAHEVIVCDTSPVASHCHMEMPKKREAKECQKHNKKTKKIQTPSKSARGNEENKEDSDEEENKLQSSNSKKNQQNSCNIRRFVDEEGIEKMEYQCQLFLVNRDKQADKPCKVKNCDHQVNECQTKLDTKADVEDVLELDSPQVKIINKIILNSNVDQLRTLVKDFEHLSALTPELIILQGCPRVHNQTKRGSIYRGVSKNGKKWQVMVMGNNCKYFSGSITSEKLAARIYDRFALQHFGLRAKTNLDYDKKTLQLMIDEIQAQIDYDIECDLVGNGSGIKNVIVLKGIMAIAEAE